MCLKGRDCVPGTLSRAVSGHLGAATVIKMNPLIQIWIHTDLATLLSCLWQSCPFLSPAKGLGNESSLWGPQLRVHIQRFPFPFSGQPRASGLTHAYMLPIPQPQLPESHPGWLFPRWRHSVHRLRLLTTSDWHHCSHLQHQHWWVIDWKQKIILQQISSFGLAYHINWGDFIWFIWLLNIEHFCKVDEVNPFREWLRHMAQIFALICIFHYVTLNALHSLEPRWNTIPPTRTHQHF